MKFAAKILMLSALPALTLSACSGDGLYGSDVYVIQRRPTVVVTQPPQYENRVVVVQPNTPPPTVTIRRAPSPVPVMTVRQAPAPIVAGRPIFEGFHHHHHHHGFGPVIATGPAPVVTVRPAPVIVGGPSPAVTIRPQPVIVGQAPVRSAPVVVGQAPARSAPIVIGQAPVRSAPAPVIARVVTNHGPVTITTRTPHTPQVGATDDAERTDVKPKTIIVGQG